MSGACAVPREGNGDHQHVRYRSSHCRCRSYPRDSSTRAHPHFGYASLSHCNPTGALAHNGAALGRSRDA